MEEATLIKKLSTSLENIYISQEDKDYIEILLEDYRSLRYEAECYTRTLGGQVYINEDPFKALSELLSEYDEISLFNWEVLEAKDVLVKLLELYYDVSAFLTVYCIKYVCSVKEIKKNHHAARMRGKARSKSLLSKKVKKGKKHFAKTLRSVSIVESQECDSEVRKKLRNVSNREYQNRKKTISKNRIIEFHENSVSFPEREEKHLRKAIRKESEANKLNIRAKQMA